MPRCPSPCCVATPVSRLGVVADAEDSPPARNRAVDETLAKFAIEHRGMRYVFEALLQEGSCASVYKATEETSQQRFAIKRLETASCGRTAVQLRREVEVHQELRHSNIAKLQCAFRSTTHFYYVYELVQGIAMTKLVEAAYRHNRNSGVAGGLDEASARLWN